MTGDNLDDVRMRIMELENSPIFDALEWSKVLADLEAAGRECALSDARRRMMTAKQNAKVVVEYSAGMPFQMSTVDV